MQLYDKDLLSVQEVRELVEKAKSAQQELAAKSQAEVDRIVKSVDYPHVYRRIEPAVNCIYAYRAAGNHGTVL